jgi:hypothetical protein
MNINILTIGRQLVGSAVLAALVCSASAFAQANVPRYAVEMVVTKNGKTVETDADIHLHDDHLVIVPDKKSFANERREFAYSSIKSADYSYAKKPMISIGGAVVAAVLISVLAPIPFLFMKKKRHWMTIQTEDGYAVLKLGEHNHRQIAADLRSRGVPVSDLKKEDK